MQRDDVDPPKDCLVGALASSQRASPPSPAVAEGFSLNSEAVDSLARLSSAMTAAPNLAQRFAFVPGVTGWYAAVRAPCGPLTADPSIGGFFIVTKANAYDPRDANPHQRFFANARRLGARLSDRPITFAFCRVAPSVRFKDLAILATGSLRAMLLRVRRSSFDQGLLTGDLLARGKALAMKAPIRLRPRYE